MVFGIDFLTPANSNRKFRVKLLNEIGSGSYAKVYQAVRIDDKTNTAYYAAKVINLKSAPKDFVTKFLPRELELCIKVYTDYPYLGPNDIDLD